MTNTSHPADYQSDAPPPTAIGWRRWCLVWGLTLLALAGSRWWLLAGGDPPLTDFGLYFRYAVFGVDRGMLPYRDIPLEYPPAAYWALAWPRWLDASRIPEEKFQTAEVDVGPRWDKYVYLLRGMLLACDVLAVLLALCFAAGRGAGRQAWAGLGLVAVLAALPTVLYIRLDLVLTFLFALIAVCWRRLDARPTAGWSMLGYAAVGWGIAFKLAPLVMVPWLVWADLVAWRRTGDRRAIVGWLVLAGTALGPFAWYYYLAGDHLWQLFAYHAQRGLQVESTGASFLWLASWAGWPVDTVHGFGAYNLEGPLAGWFVAGSTMLLVVLLTAWGAWSVACGERFSRRTGWQAATVAVLLTVALSKVLSPQYLIWWLPLAWFLGVDVLPARRLPWLLALLLAIAGLTSWLFPYNYLPVFSSRALVEHLHPLPWTALLLRNVLMLAATGWLARAVVGAAGERPSGG